MSLQEKIDTMIDVTRQSARCEGLVRHLLNQQTQNSTDPEVLEFIDKVVKAVSDCVALKSREVYASIYTEDEIDELIAHHQSPLGQKTLDTEPEVRAKIEEAVSTAIADTLSKALSS